MVVYQRDYETVDAPVTANAAEMQVEVVRGTSRLFAAMETEWTALQLETSCHSPFTSPTWLRHWVEAFAPDSTVVLVLARRSGELRGVLPLIEQRIGSVLTILKSPTNYYSGRFDIVHGAGDCLEAMQTIWNALHTQVSWDILDIRDVAERAQLEQMMKLAYLAGYPVSPRAAQNSPYLVLEELSNLDDLGPQRNIRRRKRQLEQQHQVTMERHSPIPADLIETFFNIEAAGWKGAGGTSINNDSVGMEFHRRILAESTPLFASTAHVLLADGEPLAISMGFETESVFYAHKRTYDERFRKFGPGHLITDQILRRMHARGLYVFDMMGTDEPYKMEWTDKVCAHTHYLVFRKSMKGSVLSRAARLYEHRAPQVRSLLQRLRSRTSALLSRSKSLESGTR